MVLSFILIARRYNIVANIFFLNLNYYREDLQYFYCLVKIKIKIKTITITGK
jgi:hypothetical protein